MGKKSIICIIVCLSILAVVTVTSIVMAVVKVNVNNTITRPNEVYITCMATNSDDYGEGRHAMHLRENRADEKAKIDEITRLFNQGFEQTLLKAFFGGTLGQEIQPAYSHQIGGVEDAISKSFYTANQFTAFFYYNETRVIKVGDRSMTYHYVFFNVKNEDSRQLITFGIGNSEKDELVDGKVDVSPDITDSVKPSVEFEYNYKGYANFINLYNYLGTLVSA